MIKGIEHDGAGLLTFRLSKGRTVRLVLAGADGAKENLIEVMDGLTAAVFGRSYANPPGYDLPRVINPSFVTRHASGWQIPPNSANAHFFYDVDKDSGIRVWSLCGVWPLYRPAGLQEEAPDPDVEPGRLHKSLPCPACAHAITQIAAASLQVAPRDRTTYTSTVIVERVRDLLARVLTDVPVSTLDAWVQDIEQGRPSERGKESASLREYIEALADHLLRPTPIMPS